MKMDRFVKVEARKETQETHDQRLTPMEREFHKMHLDLNRPQTDLTHDFDGYISALKELKPRLVQPHRQKREKISIFIMNYWKKNLDYYKAQDVTDSLLVGNARAPFREIEMLDYDLESDDLEA